MYQKDKLESENEASKSLVVSKQSIIFDFPKKKVTKILRQTSEYKFLKRIDWNIT